jgi:hypothetical protein
MKNLILSALALLAITGCNKYDDTGAAKLLQIPPYTETGANTFGCLLNGQVWANFGDYDPSGHLFGTASGPSPEKVGSWISFFGPNGLNTGSDTVFSVGAGYSLVKKGTEKRFETMQILLPKNGSLKGTYMLTGTNGRLEYDQVLTYKEYISNARNPTTVMVNKDSVINNGTQHIVSGRFHGVLYNRSNLKDSVSIAGGVFDTLTPP